MMAKQSKVKLTESKIALEGIQVTFTVRIGDWVRSVAISPVNYDVFKRWDEIYAKKVVDSIVKDIAAQTQSDK